MRAGLLLSIVVLGGLAAGLRAYGPPPLADIGALAYLTAATVAFGRPGHAVGRLLLPAASSRTPLHRRIRAK